MKLAHPRPNSNMVHNTGTLRCRTGLSREGAEAFLQGRQVAGASDRHICGRFGLATRPSPPADRPARPGKAGGHANGATPAVAGLGRLPADLGLLGSGGHIRPLKPGHANRPAPAHPGTILRRPDQPGEDAPLARRFSK